MDKEDNTPDSQPSVQVKENNKGANAEEESPEKGSPFNNTESVRSRMEEWSGGEGDVHPRVFQDFGGVSGRVEYPLVFISPLGTINVILKEEVVVTIAVNKTLRVCCPGKFSLASSGVESASAINHPQASILHRYNSVSANFAIGEKRSVVGPDGIVFAVKNTETVYIVGRSGVKEIPRVQVKFDSMVNDQSLSLFYGTAEYGAGMVPLCSHIVESAIYETRGDHISVHINGIHVQQNKDGDIHITSRPRQIRVSPTHHTASIHSQGFEASVQTEEKAFVKVENKRVHVSRSGMVVSDGTRSVLMDHFGRIIHS